MAASSIETDFVSQARQYDKWVRRVAAQQIKDTYELQRFGHIILTHPDLVQAIAYWTPSNRAPLETVRQLCLTWYKPCYRDLYETLHRITHLPMDCS